MKYKMVPDLKDKEFEYNFSYNLQIFEPCKISEDNLMLLQH